jgi:PAS domain S-box-containing protein
MSLARSFDVIPVGSGERRMDGFLPASSVPRRLSVADKDDLACDLGARCLTATTCKDPRMASLPHGVEEPGDGQDIRLVVDTIPTLAWSAGPDGSADFFNRRWLDYTGLSAKQALGSGWEVAIHPDDLPRILETFREALNSVKPYEVEGRFRRFDGEFRWFLFRGSPLRDRSGKVAKWYGTNTDLEERKRAEDALRKSEERWRSVFENSAIGVALTDHNGRFLATNRVFQAMVGYTEEELRAVNFLDVTHEDYREADWALITELVEGKRRQFQIEKKYRRKDGSLIWVSNNVSLVPGTEKVPRFIMALSEDITERKRAEEALRRSEAYLAEGQRLAKTGSWAYSPAAQKCICWSDEMLRIFGLDPQRSNLPDREEFLRLVHPEDRDRFNERIDKAFREKAGFVQDYRIVLTDGTVKHIHGIGHPVLDETGNIIEYVGTDVDVTERKRAEEERESLRADRAHVNRISILGELAAAVSHELKQPIAAAMTNAKTCMRWLKREQPDVDEALEATSRIVNDGTRATEIIERLRSLYKKSPQQRELVEVNEAIREIMLLLDSEATKLSVLVRTELAADLPQVMGDRVQLQQVLMNLIMNSIDAMKDVDRTRELTIQSQRSEDGQVLISVSDTGVGLPPQQADKIFDAFFTTKTQGTGMGLRISRSIVESHAGRLWATDNSPRGARFCFTLSTKAAAHDSVVSGDPTGPADGLHANNPVV